MAEKGEEDKNLFLSIIIMFTFAKNFFFTHSLPKERTSPKQNCKRSHVWAIYGKYVWGTLSEQRVKYKG